MVVIGGSYSATMATWARLKYPHLIDVGYASSAPLRAVADFFGNIKFSFWNCLYIRKNIF